MDTSGASSGTFSGHSGHVDPQLEELAAEAVARMDLVSSEVLRTTSANNALGALTLSEANEGDLYHKSRPSSRIGNFWSHSWHGGRWNKIWTLLVLYNGRAAICCGFIVSFIMMLLFALGFLPGFEKNQYLERTSVWGLGSGSLAALVTLIIWRPRHGVFLDRICINQHDSKLKAAAICSLAGMLKRSEKMLVLWDPTWSERLWCLFELAAFLKSKSENEQHALTIRPSLVGPSSTISFSVMVVTVAPLVLVPNDAENHQHILLIIFLMGSLAGLFMVSVLRGYFRSLALLEQQLNSVNFDKTRSHCCEVNHREGQETILCDRRIVKACVSKWFGSEKAFEECIRSEVMQAVMSDLQYQVFTRSGILLVTCPLMWGCLDVAVSWACIGEWSRAVQIALDGLSNWLLVTPIIADWVVFLARRYCATASSPSRDALVNLSVLLMAVPLRAFILVLYWMIERLTLRAELNSILFATVMLLVTFLYHLLKALRSGSGAKAAAHAPHAHCVGSVGSSEPWSQDGHVDAPKTMVSL